MTIVGGRVVTTTAMATNYQVPFLLSTVESEPHRFQEAMVVALRDPQAMVDIRHVLSVLRDKQALVDFNRICPPDLRLDIDPWDRVQPPPSIGETQFRKILQENGFTTLAILSDPGASRLVASIYSSSLGCVMVAKELWDESTGPLGFSVGREDQILTRLGSPFRVLSGRILVRPFEDGCPLTHGFFSAEFSRGLIHAVSLALGDLHTKGVLYMDISKSNVLTSGKLFDFSHARMCPPGGKIGTFLVDPEYAPPEVFTRREASSASDIWSLGILFHQLLTGEHPFLPSKFVGDPREHAVSHVADPYKSDGIPSDLAYIIRHMLCKNPSERPSAEDVARFLDRPGPYAVSLKHTNRPKALLPMRCGVPHNGHVNLIVKVIEMGFRPIITLQKSYTWTDQDPIPKWIVAEMLRVALSEKGYGLESVEILPTPYGDLTTHRLHFLMLPGWEDVRVIVSGNPEVEMFFRPLMEGRTFLPAQAICGDLTDFNGTKLRSALKRMDFPEIRKMLPTTVLKGWGVDSILAWFPKSSDVQVDFPVKVKVKVGSSVYPVPQYLWPLDEAIRRGGGLPLAYQDHSYDMENKTLTVTCG